MLCFNKLTGEHNTKKILQKIFVLWEYIFNKLFSFEVMLSQHLLYANYYALISLCIVDSFDSRSVRKQTIIIVAVYQPQL